jgi:hypothetical protein
MYEAVWQVSWWLLAWAAFRQDQLKTIWAFPGPDRFNILISLGAVLPESKASSENSQGVECIDRNESSAHPYHIG